MHVYASITDVTNDPTNSDVQHNHNQESDYPISLNACLRFPPTVQLKNDEASLSISEFTTAISFSVTNNDNNYCNFISLWNGGMQFTYYIPVK
jgi:hypothetical protein